MHNSNKINFLLFSNIDFLVDINSESPIHSENYTPIFTAKCESHKYTHELNFLSSNNNQTLNECIYNMKSKKDDKKYYITVNFDDNSNENQIIDFNITNSNGVKITFTVVYDKQKKIFLINDDSIYTSNINYDKKFINRIIETVIIINKHANDYLIKYSENKIK